MHNSPQIFGQEGAIVDEPILLDLEPHFLNKNSNPKLNSSQPIHSSSHFADQNPNGQAIQAFKQGQMIEKDKHNSQNRQMVELMNYPFEIGQQMNLFNSIIMSHTQMNLGDREEAEDVEFQERMNSADGSKYWKKKLKSNSETKNITKNYGKQIIRFIQLNQDIVYPILRTFGISFEELVGYLKHCKKKINKIVDLRNLWTQGKYAAPIRILSEHFLRKYSFSWIFNSRIEDITYPIKYRRRIIEGVRKPSQFEYLKEYS